MKSYDVAELVSDTGKLVYTVSHCFWVDEWKFLAHANRLHLRTLAGDRHVFDVSTGELVESEAWRPPAITAALTPSDGSTRRVLSGVRLCGGGSILQSVMARGVNAEYTLVGTRNPRPLDEDTTTVAFVSFRLEWVSTLTRRERAADSPPVPSIDVDFDLLLGDGRLLSVAPPAARARTAPSSTAR